VLITTLVRPAKFRPAATTKGGKQMDLFGKTNKTAPTAGAPTDEQNLSAKKQKYAQALEAASKNQVRLQNVHWENGKILIRGEAPSDEAKNRVWEAVRAVNPGMSTPQDATIDITVAKGQGGPAGAAQAPGRTYTVQSGDTLSKISKQFYGNPNQYMKIFEANKDKLSDPDKIKPGQVLNIPNA
jgi:nucleoid-associated protein YgaU